MLLLFADDKVADEVAGVVRTDERPLLVADAGHPVRFDLADILTFLPWLEGLTECRFTVNEPVGCWLDVVVTTQQTVVIYHGRVEREVLLEECLLAPRILHNEPETAYLCIRNHAKQQTTSQ